MNERFQEPWTTTAARTLSLAAAIGLIVALVTSRADAFLVAFAAALWFTLGGHFVELLFRNTLGPGITSGAVRTGARLGYWFAVGSLLYLGASATAAALSGRRVLPWRWWIGGAGFAGAELLVHLALRVRRQPSFYDGRG